MEKAFGLEIPETLEDACDLNRLALVVYDMQVGILKQLKNGAKVTKQVVEVLHVARETGVRVFFRRFPKKSIPIQAG